MLSEPIYKDDRSTIYCGDSMALLMNLPENSIDAIVIDPPYLLQFMGKEFERQHLICAGNNEGQKMYSWHMRWTSPALRVLKPGGYLLAFGGTRTAHRLAAAIEDAGFDLIDTFQWIFGSGFPKNADVAKALDRMAGQERSVTGKNPNHRAESGTNYDGIYSGGNTGSANITKAATAQAKEWDGWGSAIKPAHEPIIVAQKPLDTVTSDELRQLTGWDHYHTRRTTIVDSAADLEAAKDIFEDSQTKDRIIVDTFFALHEQVQTYTITVLERKIEKQWTTIHSERAEIGSYLAFTVRNIAANVLKWRTGALNIDASRIGLTNWKKTDRQGNGNEETLAGRYSNRVPDETRESQKGRWPANVIFSHDPNCKVAASSKIIKSGKNRKRPSNKTNLYHGGFYSTVGQEIGYSDMDGTEIVQAYDCVPGCPVAILDEQSGQQPGRKTLRKGTRLGGLFKTLTTNVRQSGESTGAPAGSDYPGSGGASRYFYIADWTPEDFIVPFYYCAKASRSERDKGLEDDPLQTMNRVNAGGLENDPRWGPIQVHNSHATVKPISLLRYLCRLITPPGGTVLDCFMGSGSQLVAALREDFNAIGIDSNQEYCKIAIGRVRGDIPPLFR